MSKALLVAALLLVPSLAAAQPFGFSLRAGPVWRDRTECRLIQFKEDHWRLEENTEQKVELSATLTPHYQLSEYFFVVAPLTRYFDSNQNEFAAQLEFRWPSCEPKPPWRSELNNYEPAPTVRQRVRERVKERVKAKVKPKAKDPCPCDDKK